eukprot:756983-Hanusia_phi.AAC.5
MFAFRTITKTRAIEEYGVTEDVLAKLRSMTKKSKQGYMMKLYLEKQIMEHATRQGGGSFMPVQTRIDDMFAPHKKQKLGESNETERLQNGTEEGAGAAGAGAGAPCSLGASGLSHDSMRKRIEMLYRGSSCGKRLQLVGDALAETLAGCLTEELLIRTDILSSHPGWSAHGAEARAGAGAGAFVLYVMQTAMRIEENHALEVAIRMANACSVPLFVLIPLISDPVTANERRWTFILQGVPEIQ